MSVLKKMTKKVGRFLKRNWRKIVIAAAIVWTAGLATVGTAGFGAAAGTVASGGAGATFGSVLSAAGSTFAAGISAIGGSVGIGQGANLAGFGGSGYATLGTGAAAQSLGLMGSNAAMTAGNVARQSAGSSYLPSNIVANAGNAGARQAATNTSGFGAFGPSGGNWTGSVGPAATNGFANTARGSFSTGGANSNWGSTGGFLSKPYAGALLRAGAGLIGNYMQGRADEEQWEREKPRGYWGVGLNGEADAVGPLAQPGGLMWNPNSWDRPKVTGMNVAESIGPIDPMTGEPMNPGDDTTAQPVGARRYGRI